MDEEDQEQLEDYIEMEHYITELQSGRAIHPPADFTPSQARIYRMASLFHAASSEITEPRPEFVEELQAQVLKIGMERQEGQEQKIPQQPPEEAASKLIHKIGRSISRRNVLAGGVVAAAALVVGVDIGASIEQDVHFNATYTPEESTTHSSDPLIGNTATKTWQFVTDLAQLDNGTRRFVTDTVVGYVLRDSNDTTDKNAIIAMSAACTHMGCLVQWQNGDRTFHCPCHDGRFDAYGNPDNLRSQLHYLDPLPRLNTKIEGGKIYVEVPTSVGTRGDST